MTPHDVPASQLIDKLATYLKENVEAVTPPSWADIVKTGAHVQNLPQSANWWYIRSASILHKIYAHGPLGIEKLRADYGGRKRFGVKPGHAVKSGGSIIRKALQQLEAAGYIEKTKPKGRKVTPEGRKLLKELSEEIGKELVNEVPGLGKYRKVE